MADFTMRRQTLFGVAIAILAAASPAVFSQSLVVGPMKFGMGEKDVAAQAALGAAPDYGKFWAGVWTERDTNGWVKLGQAADRLADQNVLPLVEWWYWGDDARRSCIENGCFDGRQKWPDGSAMWKDQARWRADAILLADALHASLAGRPGVLIVESEFNKNDVQTWTQFNTLLIDHAQIFRDRAPELRIGLGFGNWNRPAWATFKPAVERVDVVAFQTMRGCCTGPTGLYNDMKARDSLTSYLGAVDAVKDAMGAVSSTFPGRPMLLHDFALGTYCHASFASCDPSWEVHQATVVTSLFQRGEELRAAGLEGVVYRALKDENMDLSNYYGYTERSWGFRRLDGTDKPALARWVAGVQNARAAPGTPTTSAALEGATQVRGWFASAPTLRLTCVDRGSGCSGIEFGTNGLTWAPYSTPIPGPAGVTTYYYRSRNVTGSPGPMGVTTLSVDLQAPQLSLSRPRAGYSYVADVEERLPTGGSEAVVVGSVTASAAASDAASGIHQVRFYVDGVLRKTVAGPVGPYAWTWTCSVTQEVLSLDTTRLLRVDAEDTSGQVTSRSVAAQFVCGGA